MGTALERAWRRVAVMVLANLHWVWVAVAAAGLVALTGFVLLRRPGRPPSGRAHTEP